MNPPSSPLILLFAYCKKLAEHYTSLIFLNPTDFGVTIKGS